MLLAVSALIYLTWESVANHDWEQAEIQGAIPKEVEFDMESEGYDIYAGSSCITCHGDSFEGGLGKTLIGTGLTPEQIADKIANILKPVDTVAEVSIVYQSIEGLHAACPNHTGDWYFTGNYPTPGGNRVVNSSFINFVEGKDKRAY